MADPVLQTREFVDSDGVEMVYYYHIVDGHKGSHNVVIAAEDVDHIEAIEDSAVKMAYIENYAHPENAPPELSNADASRGDHDENG